MKPSAEKVEEARQYWGYLFSAEKKPTSVFDALLRSIATYIVRNCYMPACNLGLILYFSRYDPLATPTSIRLPLENWLPSTELSVVTMTVSYSLVSQSSAALVCSNQVSISPLFRRITPVDFVHLASYRLRAHVTALRRHLRTTVHTRALYTRF